MEADFNLSQALGDEHMRKLNDEISELIAQLEAMATEQIEVEEVIQTFSSIKTMPPSSALGSLETISHNLALGRKGAELDLQLLRKARAMGKKSFRSGETETVRREYC